MVVACVVCRGYSFLVCVFNVCVYRFPVVSVEYVLRSRSPRISERVSVRTFISAIGVDVSHEPIREESEEKRPVSVCGGRSLSLFVSFTYRMRDCRDICE